MVNTAKTSNVISNVTKTMSQWQNTHPSILLKPFCTSYASKNYDHLYQVYQHGNEPANDRHDDRHSDRHDSNIDKTFPIRFHIPIRHNAYTLTCNYFCPSTQKQVAVATHIIIGSLDLTLGLPKHTHTLCIEYIFQHPYLEIINANSPGNSQIVYEDKIFDEIVAAYAEKHNYTLYSELRQNSNPCDI